MLISVDFPAPFSPSSACTSPRRKSKSMWSLASTPGNCFVIPRSSRTAGASSTVRLNNRAGPEARSVVPRDSCYLPAGNDRRRLQLAADDLLLQQGDLRQPRLLQMCLGADLPEPDPAVLQVEDEVLAAPVALAALGAFDGEIDPVVQPLHGTREDVSAEVGL